jgi:Coenzyme PQQ synthesis protein D (PqqD)
MIIRSTSISLHISDDVIWDEVDGVLAVYNLATKSRFELNDTASLLWQWLISELEIDPLKAMSDCYPDVEFSRIQSDVESILIQLLASRVIEERPCSS